MQYPARGDYGNIMNVDTTGASDETAAQDNLDCTGEDASHAMAEMDVKRLKKYWGKINGIDHYKKVDRALIAAIISRESRAGNKMEKTRGWGDGGKAFGLMQVDVHPDGGNHTPVGEWDSYEHLEQATDILIDFIEKIRDKFPSWTMEQQLKGGIAAYNTGDGKVHSYERVDAETKSGDYSNDVIARAQWYRKNGHF